MRTFFWKKSSSIDVVFVSHMLEKGKIQLVAHMVIENYRIIVERLACSCNGTIFVGMVLVKAFGINSCFFEIAILSVQMKQLGFGCQQLTLRKST